MKKTRLGLYFLGAAAAGLVVACGGITDPEGGTTGDPCDTSAECATGYACHPGLNTCEETCDNPTECAASTSVCASINSSEAKFCQCATGAAGDETCTEASEGRTPYCNTKTLRCSATQEEPEGKAEGEACSDTETCLEGLGCHPTLNTCQKTCDDTQTQPTVCAHGDWCAADDLCEPVAAGTCANITSSSHVAGTTGPIIYAVTSVAPNESWCAAGTAFTADVFAYAAAGSEFGASASTGLAGGSYYTTSGEARALTSLNSASGYSLIDGGKAMKMRVNFCSTSAVTSIAIGVGFTNGNGFCATVTRP